MTLQYCETPLELHKTYFAVLFKNQKGCLYLRSPVTGTPVRAAALWLRPDADRH